MKRKISMKQPEELTPSARRLKSPHLEPDAMISNPQDRRTQERLDLLEYALIFTPEGDGVLRSIVSDVSIGGLQLRCRAHIPSGFRTLIQVGRLGEEPMKVTAVAVYSRRIEGTDLFATGFRVTPDSAGEKSSWGRFVHETFRRQADQLAS
jgi:hypothetical protein